MAKFKKGKSGNSSGRPKGSRNMATIRADELFEQMLFGEDKKADAIIPKTISMAEEGDTACIRLCLDRIAPPRKDRPVCFTLPEMREAQDALNASMAIVSGVASGETDTLRGFGAGQGRRKLHTDIAGGSVRGTPRQIGRESWIS
jgi:Family of unknown function (DUF5681)